MENENAEKLFSFFCIQIQLSGYWKWKPSTNAKIKPDFLVVDPIETENEYRILHFFSTNQTASKCFWQYFNIVSVGKNLDPLNGGKWGYL